MPVGYLINELPFVGCYWMAASTLLAFARVTSTRRAHGWWWGWPR